MKPIDNLESLYLAMLAHDPRVCTANHQWRTDLPTFGGAAPKDTLGVWSWDAESLLIGNYRGDLEIVPRKEPTT